VVEFGGNDGLRGLPIADTRRNLSTIVSTLLHAGSKVVLAGITLPPNYGSDYIQPFNETFRLIATQYRVPLLPMLYANVYTVPGAIQEDGVHPTAKGAQLLTDNFLPLLLPLLHK
jgi:acyl-CoA thioesterase-1